ncbi:Crp/Fnr family transcriptional regulator [Qipengyuania sp.]|uniref:Crp/Fnr family transcriptional regulator n=1 Tax=Qipengyuania sp. TaxID=2004515 RepID=UPI0035C7A653
MPWLETFKTGEVTIDRGGQLIEQGSEGGGLFTVLSGMLMRYQSLDDGRRQIVNFMFPGDLIGLQGAFDGVASHSVEALLPSRLCTFDPGKFFDLIAARPALGYDITWLAAKEERALEAHLVALGRRSAKERVAYLAIWLLRRAVATCTAVGRHRLEVAITQAQISDMLGLSLVHTNRTIKALEREQLVIWKPNGIEIPDLDAAARYAQISDEVDRPRPYI